jgi:PAS domain S-box-containing protein
VDGGVNISPQSEPGTDWQVPTALDKALLGGQAQRIGRFEYRYDTETWTWSDTVARMHGYEPGEVQPTTDLVLGHKHPEDLAQVKSLLKQSSAPFSSRHRIRTKHGDIRKVVVVGEAVTEADGSVVATRGLYVDVTEAVRADVQDQVGAELQNIVAKREVIEQAKGMLMAVYDVTADAAFDVLRWRSQEMNVRVQDIARQVVATVPALLAVDASSHRSIDHFLMTLAPP